MNGSYAPPVQRLVTELSKLPGVGNRTAQRLAFHILRTSSDDATALAEAIAVAGQARTLRDHTYDQRMPELAVALEQVLTSGASPPRAHHFPHRRPTGGGTAASLIGRLRRAAGRGIPG